MLDLVVNEIIEKAMKEGKFDNLRGAGKPFNWEDETFVDPSTRVTNAVLRGQGFAPEPIERRRTIKALTKHATDKLRRSWRLVAQQRAVGIHDERVEELWQRAEAGFRKQVTEINDAIRNLNLSVDQAALRMRPLDADQVIQEVTGEGR